MVGGQFYNIRNDFIGFDWLSLRHSRQPIKLNLLLGRRKTKGHPSKVLL